MAQVDLFPLIGQTALPRFWNEQFHAIVVGEFDANPAIPKKPARPQPQVHDAWIIGVDRGAQLP